MSSFVFSGLRQIAKREPFSMLPAGTRKVDIGKRSPDLSSGEIRTWTPGKQSPIGKSRGHEPLLVSFTVSTRRKGDGEIAPQAAKVVEFRKPAIRPLGYHRQAAHRAIFDWRRSVAAIHSYNIAWAMSCSI
jgi:hypothetical protein